MPRSRLSGPSSVDEARWRAESDVRTLRDAEAIRGDRKRFAAAQKCAQADVAALQRITKGAKLRKLERKLKNVPM